MLLNVRILTNVVDANTFDYADAHQTYVGVASTVYFQLFDPTKDPGHRGFKPEGRRYMPASGATMVVSLDSLDDSKKITDRVATQPFALDPSIWALSLLTTDTIVGTTNLRFKLTEGVTITCGRSEGAVLIGKSIY